MNQFKLSYLTKYLVFGEKNTTKLQFLKQIREKIKDIIKKVFFASLNLKFRKKRIVITN